MLHNPEMTFVQPSPGRCRSWPHGGPEAQPRAGQDRGARPLKGFSYPNHEGRPLYNPAGVRAFVKGLQGTIDPAVPVRLLPLHVNDPAFADAVVEEFERLAKGNRPPRSEIKQRRGEGYVHRKDH